MSRCRWADPEQHGGQRTRQADGSERPDNDANPHRLERRAS